MTASPSSIEKEIKQLELDTYAALRWAEAGKIDAWVHKYLLSGKGGESNSIFSEGLKRERRWWNGPVEIDLSALSPAVGTNSSMEYVVDAADWLDWTSAYAKTFTSAMALPPLIVEYRAGELSIRDGNTRHGAMQLLGWSSCWVVIWYNSEGEYQQHTPLLLK